MKKLMVLGASEFQIPLLQEAKRRNIYTYLLDINPLAPAISYADEYISCSLKDCDKALEIAKKINPDGITAGASDVPVYTAARLCEALGLPGLSVNVASKATDKKLMIEAFAKENVPHPKYLYFTKDTLDLKKINNLDYPLISKPTDMSGSRGIQLIESPDNLEACLNESFNASINGTIILEEFMRGPEVSVEMIVKDYVPTVIQITDKITTGAPYFIEVGHSQPSQLDIVTKEQIKIVACGAAKAIGAKDSIIHAEIIVTKNGPKMVELGARMGADSIQEQLLELSTGISMPSIAISIALNEVFEVPKPKINKCSAIKFIQSSLGIVKSIEGENLIKEIPGIKYKKLFCKVGDKGLKPVDNSGRFGYVISQSDTVLKALQICDEALCKIKISIE